jgi:hypothetical protein
VEKGPPGVYSIWRNDTFVYVGMSWREPTPTSSGNSPGLWGRLNSHASGRRSGDQFCIYICDRFVLPELTPVDLREIVQGNVSLDVITKNYVRNHLNYRYVTTKTGAEARALEASIRSRGLPNAGKPFLNPSS